MPIYTADWYKFYAPQSVDSSTMISNAHEE